MVLEHSWVEKNLCLGILTEIEQGILAAFIPQLSVSKAKEEKFVTDYKTAQFQALDLSSAPDRPGV